MKSIVNVDQEIYDHQSVQRLFRRNFAPDEPACLNVSIEAASTGEAGKCFLVVGGPRSGRTKLKINA